MTAPEIVQTRLVLLPGLDGTGQLFAPLVRALPPTLQPVVVSYPRETALGYDDLLARVRDALPSDGPFALLGESFSGPIALRIAAERPAGLVGLILCATFARSPLVPRSPLNAPLAALFWVRPPRWAIRFVLTGWDVNDELVDQVRAAIASVDRRVIRRRFQELLDLEVAPDSAPLALPVLYLAARHDRLVRERALRPIRALCADLRVVALDAPHLVLQRRSAEAAAAIAGFLAAQPHG